MINAIFAVDARGGMGINGSLPWPHNSEDLRRFKEFTLGDVVVMGRRTWDDPKMPKPLPGRTSVVLTSKPLRGTITKSGDIPSILLGLEKEFPTKNIWVIGGPDIIMSARSLYDSIYLTHLKSSYKIDTRIDLADALRGFTPKRASSFSDFSGVQVQYENIFKRSRADSQSGS
jgi:dihydrofolate reductase